MHCPFTITSSFMPKLVMVNFNKECPMSLSRAYKAPSGGFGQESEYPPRHAKCGSDSELMAQRHLLPESRIATVVLPAGFPSSIGTRKESTAEFSSHLSPSGSGDRLGVIESPSCWIANIVPNSSRISDSAMRLP